MSRCVLYDLLLLFIAASLPRAAAAAELVMFESQACARCAAWHAEIGPIYPKTREGQLAPLRRVDIHAPRPADLELLGGIRFTPTFVLISDGREIGRIVGYLSEDFFWGQLNELLRRLEQSQGAAR